MKSTIAIFFFLATIIPIPIVAQVVQEWLANYDSSLTSFSTSEDLRIDKSGNILLCLKSSDDIALIKYNQSGNLIWLSRYNGGEDDQPNAMTIDNYGSTIITGRSEAINTEADFITLKINSSGSQLWAKRYSSGGMERDASYDVDVDLAGNVFVTGETYNDTTIAVNCLTIKYDSAGNQQWARIYQSNSAIGYALICDSQGNVFVTGRSDGDIFTIKYNTLGNQQWITFYDSPFQDEDSPNCIGLDFEGNVYVSGVSSGLGGYWDYVIIKYSQNGQELWSRRYNGSANFMDQLNDMKIDAAGNIYVTGNATQTGNGYDYTTIKFNSNGDQLWIAKYHNGLNDIAVSLALDSFGNVYVTGRSDGNGTRKDFSTVKYDPSGNELWSIRYNSLTTSDDEARAIAINENNVFVTGVSYISGGEYSNAITIKYSQIITNSNTGLETVPESFELFQNFPNPFNPITTINYECSLNSNILLKVYDSMGKEIRTLVNENQETGLYKVEFDASNLPSGIYFYKYEVDGIVIETKRMILLK